MNHTTFCFVRNTALFNQLSLNVQLENMLNFMAQNPDKALDIISKDYNELLEGHDKTKKSNKRKLIVKRDAQTKKIQSIHAIGNDNRIFFTFDARPHKRIAVNPILIYSLNNNKVSTKEYNVRKHLWISDSQRMPLLPRDLIFCIMRYLKPSDLLNARLVCKKWKEIAEHGVLWEPYLSVLRKVYKKSGCKICNEWKLETLLPHQKYIRYALLLPKDERNSWFILLLSKLNYVFLFSTLLTFYTETKNGLLGVAEHDHGFFENLSSDAPYKRACIVGYTQNHVIWIGQKASNIYEFVDERKDKKREISVATFIEKFRNYVDLNIDVKHMNIMKGAQ